MQNIEQLSAINHIDGPMMVIAGPGSGKTYTITKRLIHMTETGIPPENILVITFTKAAANEMRERYIKASSISCSQIYFGTFHSLFLSILKENNIYNNFSIITETERTFIIDSILKATNNSNSNLINSEIILKELSYIKNEGLNIDEYTPRHISKDIFQKIYQKYRKRMKELNKIEFDDMLSDCYSLLANNNDILEKYRKIYKYIIIDEFQDINNIQFKIIMLLASPNNNIFIVGDDDQSIYKFRGSKPEIMLSFKNFFPKTKIITLKINYRSTSTIVKTSLMLINHNKKRFNKKLTSSNTRDLPLNILNFNTKKEEYKNIIKIIKTIGRNKSFSDIAIIFRTNKASKYLIKELVENNIPYLYKEKHQSLFDNQITKDILSIIFFVNQKPLRKYLLSFINKPLRYIPRELFNEEEVNFEKIINNNSLENYQKNNLLKLIKDLNFLRGKCPYIALDYILNNMNYNDYLKNKYKDPEEYEEEKEIIIILKDLFKEITNINEIENYIKKYEQLNKESLNCIDTQNKVNIMTMHSSKGLEFNTVIIPDLNEGYMPPKKCKTDEDIEEERRVFYVAITRAKENLYLTYLDKGNETNKNKSSFLQEIKTMIK